MKTAEEDKKNSSNLKMPESILEVREKWNQLAMRIVDDIGLVVGLSPHKKTKGKTQTKETSESKPSEAESVNEKQLLEKIFIDLSNQHNLSLHTFPKASPANSPKPIGFDKSQFLEDIVKSINQENRKSTIICLSGRGQWDGTFTEVVFMLDENEKGEDKHVRIGNILKVWNERKNKETNKHLLIIVDFNFCGFWADQARRLDIKDVSVQSSSKPEQECKRVNKYFGLFLNNWLFSNNNPSIAWISPIKALNVTADKINDVQTPNFYGDFDTVNAHFGLKFGFNNWDDLLISAKKETANGLFIGQTLFFQDELTENWTRKAHGRGALFNLNKELVKFGTWEESVLVQKEEAELLKGEYSESDIINVKLDIQNNLTIGYFYASQLSSKGEIITQTGNHWVGEFQDGSICGNGVWSYIDAWKVEGVRDFDCFEVVKRVFNEKGEERTGFVKKSETLNGKKKVIDDFGNMFIGSFKNGEMVGTGKWKSPHGFFIEAEFEKGHLVELSEILDYKGEPIEGDLIDEESNGPGFYITDEFGFYEGNLVKGKREGLGIWLNNNGDFYKGHFHNNVLHGKGFYICANGDSYEQDWKDGKMASQSIKSIDIPPKTVGSDDFIEVPEAELTETTGVTENPSS